MFTVDGQEGIRDPVGMTGVRLETDTHIVTASTGAMKNLVRCMSLVGGINIDELVFSGIAASYATLTDTEKELGVILVDIGGETTDIVIFVDGAIAHSAVIPIGARHITSDLAVGLRVSLESAEKIKVYLGKLIKAPTLPEATEKGVKVKDELIDIKSLGITEEIKMSKKTAVDSIIRPRTREIFELIGKEIKKSGFATQTPSGLVICGGGASTVGILEQAKYTLGYPARVGRPEGLNGLTEEIDSPSFAAAAGLILYGSKSAVSNNFGLPALTTGLPIQKLVQKGIDLVKSFLP